MDGLEEFLTKYPLAVWWYSLPLDPTYNWICLFLWNPRFSSPVYHNKKPRTRLSLFPPSFVMRSFSARKCLVAHCCCCCCLAFVVKCNSKCAVSRSPWERIDAGCCWPDKPRCDQVLFYKATGEEFRKSVKFYKNSVFRVSFSRKSASARGGEFRRSVEKLPEFRIPRQIFFKFPCSANPDDPHLQTCFYFWLTSSTGRPN